MKRTVSELRIPFTAPMECLPVDKVPTRPGWVYELKLDGYRGQAVHDAAGVRLYSKNGRDFTARFPRLLMELNNSLPAGTALDGELVALDARGEPSFAAMQDATAEARILFFAFDVLWFRWKEIKPLYLGERLNVLQSAFTPTQHVLHCEHFSGPADRFLKGVQRIGGEGVVAKRLDSRYEPGKRSGAWSKTRLNKGQEFVIGGFTPGSHGFDALVVGFYQRRMLMYAARVRAGFIPSQRRDLYSRLTPLISNSCPFTNLPEKSSGRWGQGLTEQKMRDCIWVKPTLVANCEFLEWTDSNHVRHIKFTGLRTDKAPQRVVRE